MYTDSFFAELILIYNIHNNNNIDDIICFCQIRNVIEFRILVFRYLQNISKPSIQFTETKRNNFYGAFEKTIKKLLY